MRTSSIQKLQQSPATACAVESTCWQLAAGRAMTLQSREVAELQVSHGRIWATVDGPHAGPANHAGDLVLRVGERLTLLPGQRVVIESWHPVVQGSACFVWKTHSGSRWQLAVAQAAHAGGQLLGIVARARASFS